MALVLILLLLVFLTGGLGFTGFVALGSLELFVKVLFVLLLLGLIVSVARAMMGRADPYDAGV